MPYTARPVQGSYCASRQSWGIHRQIGVLSLPSSTTWLTGKGLSGQNSSRTDSRSSTIFRTAANSEGTTDNTDQETSTGGNSIIAPSQAVGGTATRAQKSTVALAKLPDGRVVDLRTVRGCIQDARGRRMVCPYCEGNGFIKTAIGNVDACPICRQWPKAGPLRRAEDIEWDESDWEDLGEDDYSKDALKARLLSNKKRRAGAMPLEQRQKISASLKGRKGTSHQEETKRRIAWEMKRLQGDEAHRKRISAALTGKPKVCSLCGQPGHNRRGCPSAKSLGGKEGEVSVTERQRKLLAEQKVQAERELKAERERRRQERLARPKSRFKGLTWHTKSKRWHAQLWTGATVKNLGYFEGEEEAAKAYDTVALEIRGPDAELNFPPEENRPKRAAIGSRKFELPMSSDAAVEQAVECIKNAWKSNLRRQRVEFLLPQEITGGGMRQEFAAARDMVEATLLKLRRQPGLEGRISVQWLDRSDYVGSWQSENLAAVVFPTADSLQQLRNIDGGSLSQRLTLVFNPQWQIDGQIVSDFGFGKSRRDAEDFVRSFEDVFLMQRRRVLGDNVRLLKCFGGKWQVHYIWPNGKGQVLVSSESEAPSYERLLQLLQKVPGSKASRSWVERVLSPDWVPGASQKSRFTPDVSPSGYPVAEGVPEQAPAATSPVAWSRDHIPLASASGVDAVAVQGDTELSSSRQTDLDAERKVKGQGEAGDPAGKHDASAAGRPGAVDQTAPAGGEAEGSPATAARARRNIVPRVRPLPDRFGDGQAIRDLRLDPVLQLPQWQRQIFGSSRERREGRMQQGTDLAVQRRKALQALETERRESRLQQGTDLAVQRREALQALEKKPDSSSVGPDLPVRQRREALQTLEAQPDSSSTGSDLPVAVVSRREGSRHGKPQSSGMSSENGSLEGSEGGVTRVRSDAESFENDTLEGLDGGATRVRSDAGSGEQTKTVSSFEED